MWSVSGTILDVVMRWRKSSREDERCEDVSGEVDRVEVRDGPEEQEASEGELMGGPGGVGKSEESIVGEGLGERVGERYSPREGTRRRGKRTKRDRVGVDL